MSYREIKASLKEELLKIASAFGFGASLIGQLIFSACYFVGVIWILKAVWSIV